jgi:hypothetical protein
MSGINPDMAKRLYRNAINWGARPGEWFVGFEPIQSDKFLSIELFDGEKWK